MSIRGKKIVFTGKLSKTRSQLTKEAEDAGADVLDDVSSNVDMLVCGPDVTDHSKYLKAQELGVVCINEAEYRNRLHGRSSSRNVNPSSNTSTNTQEISSFYQSFLKSELVVILEKIGGETCKKSWSKSKLIAQLENHSIEKVLKQFTSVQLKTGLEKMGLSTTGNKSECIDRILSSCNAQSIIGKKCLDCNTDLHSMNRGQTNYCRECKPMEIQPICVFEGVESEFEELVDMFGEEIARSMLY